MLVYANSLQLTGPDARESCFRAIHGWLIERLGLKISISEISRPGEWKGDCSGRPAWLKSYAAIGDEPELYAWRLKHSDIGVSGRQWLVELGLKIEAGMVDFSCAINTDEQSVLISEPVSASRPRVIRYLMDIIESGVDAEFAAGTVGVALKMVGDSVDSYRGFLADLQHVDRDWPIVLVSPTRDGEYLVRPEQLQKSLLGLAQVVQVHLGFSSWDMEENLGRRFSAWDGAINIIKAPNRQGVCSTSICLGSSVKDWGGSMPDRISHLLGLITHLTNVPKQRSRVRPDGVARLQLLRRIAAQKDALKNRGGSEQGMIKLLEEGVNDLTEQLRLAQELSDEKEMYGLQVEDEKLELERDLATERYTVSQLRQQLRDSTTVDSSEDLEYFMGLAGRQDQPSVRECLEAVAKAYPKRVVVLSTAYDSANRHANFDYGRRLLGMLNKLATKFVDELKEGGDEQARRCFSNSEYAATESEGTQKNKEMRKRRTFVHGGAPVVMMRHLKIGVADDERKSIRVYFEWMPDEGVIVIGHCGAHLPVVSH